MTEAEVIQSARDRIGNKLDRSVAEQVVDDNEVKAEMQDWILQCYDAFGASAAKIETGFVTTQGAILDTPAAPTLTPATSGGVLGTGTYSYRIAAVREGGETAAGTAASAVVTGPAGSVTVAWPSVPNAGGYRIYGRSAGDERLLVEAPGAASSWKDTGRATPGAIGAPGSNSTGGGWLQDYDLETYVGSDVREVVEVLREDATLADESAGLFGLGAAGGGYGGAVDPRDGLPYRGGAFVPQGGQIEAYQTIVAQARYRQSRQFDWSIVNAGGRPALRLMPRPTSSGRVVVTYIAAAGSIASLPEEARAAAELAACLAFLDCMLNRVRSNPAAIEPSVFGGGRGEKDTLAWLDSLTAQRDRYEKRFRAAVRRRG